MIESGRDIKSKTFQPYVHEHEVTQCLNETTGEPKSGGRAAEGAALPPEQNPPSQQPFSIAGFVANGFKGLISKAVDFWNDEGNAKEREKNSGEDKLQASSAAASIAATAVIKKEDRKNENIILEEKTDRKVSNVEGTVSGKAGKGQGGIKRFLHKFGDTIAKARRIIKKGNEEDMRLPENNTLIPAEDNSYLLDSYNKVGQYSTLAKDRSLEGNFKAKG